LLRSGDAEFGVEEGYEMLPNEIVDDQKDGEREGCDFEDSVWDGEGEQTGNEIAARGEQ
jgi:hypothetical protein